MAGKGEAAPQRQGRKPNVILIMLDDLGSIDVNCYGAKDLVTPNLDALAGSGVRFTQMCSASPVCSPSRAAVLTGRVPLRAGLPNNAGSQPGGKGLPAEEVTLARVMKDAGYATGHVGKWHLGYTPEEMPNARGFDSSFGHMGGCIDNYSHFFYWEGPNRHDLWQNGNETWRSGEHIGDLMVEQCNKFIEAQKDKPFFLFWAINQPHYPLQGKAKWREHYRDLASPRNMYAASVSTLDELIGRVMAKVKSLGLANDTIVALQSDHGHSTEERSFGGGGNAGPYRGAKFSMFEGGIRVVSMLS
jgi:arylsulfatase A-like enzyme